MLKFLELEWLHTPLPKGSDVAVKCKSTCLLHNGPSPSKGVLKPISKRVKLMFAKARPW